MVAATAVLAVLGTLVLIEGLAFVLYTKLAPLDRRRVLDFLIHRRIHPFTAASQRASQAAAPRYTEHPFTAWSLSPEFRNIHGERVHNRQGFRCATDFDDLDPEAFRIYCAGGSSTYCTDIERNVDTWPELLGQQLTTETGRKVQVINGGVGGFNSFQSYIRLSAYIDHLRPDLVVVYHAKNDLTAFYNSDMGNGKVLPDYSNAMRSLSFRGMSHAITPLARWSHLARLWTVWRCSYYSSILAYVYDHNREADVSSLLAARTDFSIIETMHRNMTGLCRGREVKLVYMTQRIDDPVFNRSIQAINERIRRLESRQQGCFVYDLDRDLPYDPELLIDKIHFAPLGCQQVASHLARFVVDCGLVSKVGQDVFQKL